MSPRGGSLRSRPAAFGPGPDHLKLAKKRATFFRACEVFHVYSGVVMQTFRMNTSLLPGFLEALKRWGTLVAPVERSPGVFSLEEIDDVKVVRPDALRTVVPFKKLLLKPRFTMFEKVGGEQVREGARQRRRPGRLLRRALVRHPRAQDPRPAVPERVSGSLLQAQPGSA